MTFTGVPQRGARLTVRIEGMDDEGRGRGVITGPTPEDQVDVAVRGGFPGDRVEVVVERVFERRRLVATRMTRLLHEGEARVESACEHQEPCVGCPLGALEYSAQLALKRGRVLQALEDEGHDFEVDDIVPSSPPWGYRQKVKLVVGGRRGRVHLGLYRPYSHVIVRCERCGSHRPALQDAASELADALNRASVAPIYEDAAGLKAVVLREMQEGVGLVVIAGAALSPALWEELSALCDAGVFVSVSERVDASEGNSLLGGAVERVLGPPEMTPIDGGPRVPVDAFCQADPVGARHMYELVADYVREGPPGWVVDAYAGTGGFARAVLATGDRDVTCVERAAASAGALAALGAEAIASDVGEALTELQARAQQSRPAAVIADPPRRGIHDDGVGLAGLQAARFALVSCDPDSMARDLTVLQAAGYEVERVVPIDLFAGTPEVEVVTLLRRTGT